MIFDSLEEIVWMRGYRSYRKELKQYLWTAGYEKNGVWNWYFDHEDYPLTVSDWAPGQPDNHMGSQHCLALFGDWAGHTDATRYRFDDIGCEMAAAYVCEKNA